LARLGKYEQKTLLKIIRGVSPNYLVFHVKPLHPMSFPCDRLFKFSLLMSIGSVNLAQRKCTEARYRGSLPAYVYVIYFDPLETVGKMLMKYFD
jgi:hypothetical protein